MRVRFAAGWVLCVLALLRADVLTCSCIWAGSFLTVGPQEELIVRGKVLSYRANAMDVEVYEAFKGDPKAGMLRVWGDNGILCRPYVTSFPLGSEWVFAVRSNPETADGGYVISACGEYAVRVERDSVSGRLTATKTPNGPPETMSLKEFRTRLQTGN
jgi:hypothetical protein